MSSQNTEDIPVICQLVHTLETGGAEVLARQFSLCTPGEFKFVFACLDRCGQIGEQLRDAGFAVEVLGRRPGFDFRCVRRLRRFLVQHRVALIHAHQYGPFFYAGVARGISRRVPILFTEHGRDYPDFRRPKRVFANRLLLSAKDRVVAVGECVRQALIDHEGIRPERVEVVFNGIDTVQYCPRRDGRAATRQTLGISPTELAIIQVARLDRLKDQATTLRSVARLIDMGCQVKLLMVGEGPERRHLEETVAELGIQSHVRFLGTRTDVPQLLAAADIFLLTSHTEGISLALIEAMACGLPCVATRVGGNSEVIVDGSTGLLADAGSAESVAECLRRILQDEPLRQKMAAAARQRVEQRFDHQTMHNSYGYFYAGMTGQHSAVAEEAPTSKSAIAEHAEKAAT